MDPESGPRSAILTIGHSTRSLAELIELLRVHGVTRLVDVRTLPRSVRHPHFNRDRLTTGLVASGIAYEHRPALGGLRKPRADSINLGLRSPGFRGFADHMQTRAFADALHDLIMRARLERIAFMCAEADPWHCHRSLIADALVARGIPVLHVLGVEPPVAHRLHPSARSVEHRVVYPR